MKHQHAIRLIHVNGRPIEALAIYEAESANLTIEDFYSINGVSNYYQYGVSFYIGFMTKTDAYDKLTSMGIKINNLWNQI